MPTEMTLPLLRSTFHLRPNPSAREPRKGLFRLPLLAGVLALVAATTAAPAQSSLRGWGTQNFDSRWADVRDYVQIAAGHDSTFARRAGGSIVAWGDNSYDQLEVPSLPLGLTYVRVAAGARHAVAIRSDGSALAWGDNSHGQLGVPALPQGVTYADVASGRDYSVALRSDGNLVAWGDNSAGQIDVPGLPQGLTYVRIWCGGRHAFARRSDGSVVGWGDNWWFQLDLPVLPQAAASRPPTSAKPSPDTPRRLG